MVEEEGKKVYVRGRWIDFSKDKINSGPADSQKGKMEGNKENPL